MFNANSSDITQLEFNQAMSDFKHMFPDMPEEKIESVLRANNGVVDSTIDQLLFINQEESQKKNSFQDSSKKDDTLYKQNIFVDDGLGTSSFKSCGKNLNFITENKISKDSLRFKHRWEPPILGELAPDFLRITLNNTQKKLANLNLASADTHQINSSFLQQKMEENQRNRQMTSSSVDPEMAQYLEDERFAILLQNEEFVRELRMNQEFMSSLATENYHQSSNQNSDPSSSITNFLDSDAAFKERLRNMGKVSKKKFNQIAKIFSKGMRKNFKQFDSSANANDKYFYQDLSNDNYEDVVPSSSETRQTSSTSSRATTARTNYTSGHTIENSNFEDYTVKRL
ncbi:CUE domain-containing protein 1 [Sarcoptes scabiei]|uniref:CUE domain-containing protein 1 n=1 Tax=Sarcoptes scabiei TaxID=52283 RepID=A0A131ZSR4_SARSC|nr:CUE domain-containing protein 1 [Sarcoptes scabiei]KPL96808.1 CUE domain-containing protein 1-like protein [Sarcoptes scabiei]UXI17903.1 hypothetical protein NH340_JMT03846 [Sarcoptes scabiei]